MNLNTPEQVPFELLHLELVSQIIHHQTSSSGSSDDPSTTSKLELLGFNTGYRFIERLAKDYPKFKDELDLLKFICNNVHALEVEVEREDFDGVSRRAAC